MTTELALINFSVSVGGRQEFQFAETTEVAANMDIESGEVVNTKSGIEHLLRASTVRDPEPM